MVLHKKNLNVSAYATQKIQKKWKRSCKIYMAQGPFAGRVKIINGATVSGQVHVSCVESVGYTKVKYYYLPGKTLFLWAGF